MDKVLAFPSRVRAHRWAFGVTRSPRVYFMVLGRFSKIGSSHNFKLRLGDLLERSSLRDESFIQLFVGPETQDYRRLESEFKRTCRPFLWWDRTDSYAASNLQARPREYYERNPEFERLVVKWLESGYSPLVFEEITNLVERAESAQAA